MCSPRLRSSGFTLVEIMVSIVVLFLGVITAGGVMVVIQQGANFSETRYQDFADLRARVERMKTQVSQTALLSGTSKALIFPATFKTAVNHDGVMQYEIGAAGLPNLVWVEMVVQQENGAGPMTFTTYLRANE